MVGLVDGTGVEGGSEGPVLGDIVGLFDGEVVGTGVGLFVGEDVGGAVMCLPPPQLQHAS